MIPYLTVETQIIEPCAMSLGFPRSKFRFFCFVREKRPIFLSCLLPPFQRGEFWTSWHTVQLFEFYGTSKMTSVANNLLGLLEYEDANIYRQY